MYLGIDTSCYTTSVAIVDSIGEIVADKRKTLIVEEGKRGLRQSEGLFQHVKNLPLLVDELREFLPQVKGVAVSAKPRNREDSYMPVFLAGEGVAKSIAAALDVPLVFTDHQSGHIMAASKSSGFLPMGKFIAIHLSGGTTEILLVEDDNFEIVGRSLDIPAGQLIDRTGVMCEEKFPCGKWMDQGKLETKITLPVSVRESDINFSGAEITAERLYKSGTPKGEIYTAVFECIAKSLEKAIKSVGEHQILPVGGVSSNSFIKEYLKGVFGERVHFAQSKYMTDNAVGTAYICREKLFGVN